MFLDADGLEGYCSIASPLHAELLGIFIITGLSCLVKLWSMGDADAKEKLESELLEDDTKLLNSNLVTRTFSLTFKMCKN